MNGGVPMAQDIAESVLLAQLDDFQAPQCEAKIHSIEPLHHAGVATFLISTPCGHSNGYRCTPQINFLLSRAAIGCSHCGFIYGPEDLTVIPIGGNK